MPGTVEIVHAVDEGIPVVPEERREYLGISVGRVDEAACEVIGVAGSTVVGGRGDGAAEDVVLVGGLCAQRAGHRAQLPCGIELVADLAALEVVFAGQAFGGVVVSPKVGRHHCFNFSSHEKSISQNAPTQGHLWP